MLDTAQEQKSEVLFPLSIIIVAEEVTGSHKLREKTLLL